MNQTTNYGGVDLTLHPILKAAHRVACLIEKCGASPALTKASCAAFDLLTPLQVLVLQLKDEREARDKWRSLYEEAIQKPLSTEHQHAWEGNPAQCAICGTWRALSTERTSL